MTYEIDVAFVQRIWSISKCMLRKLAKYVASEHNVDALSPSHQVIRKK